MNVKQRESGTSDGLDRAEKRARLEASVKTYDGFFSTFFVNPYTKHVAKVAARLGLSPLFFTLVSLAVGLGAAGCFAVGGRGWLVAGAVLLVSSFYLDGVDGTLARLTGRTSAFGAWLDSICDRGKEYAVYAGLAIGSVRAYDEDVWLLATCALALQTVRHVADVAYVRAGLSRGGAGRTSQRAPAPGRLGPLRRSSIPVWAHRLIRFPVGERLVLIALTAALFTPRTTFVALLVWGGIAGLYTLIGRLAYDHPATRRAVRGVLG